MTRPGRATFTRESAERIARAVRQVELGTPAARPLSFGAVLAEAARNRTTSDVRVAERAMISIGSPPTPSLDYSQWPTGGTKKVVISGEFWDNPAAAFSGSGSLGTASYAKSANYPAQENQSCSFTVNVTDTRVPDPEAVPPQTAETYSIPVRIPGVGTNKEGILPMASVGGSAAWNVEAGTLTVSLMPGQSQTVTANGTCLQNGFGKHIQAQNVGPAVEQFEVNPGPRYMVVRRDEDASPRWMAVALDPQQSVYGRFHGRVPKGLAALVGIRHRYDGTNHVLDSVFAANPFGAVGTPLSQQEQTQRNNDGYPLFWLTNLGTRCLLARADHTLLPNSFGSGWILVAAEC